MNLRQNSLTYDSNQGDGSVKPSSKSKQTSNDKQFGALALGPNIGFQNQVGTMVHSNQLSSLVASNAQNTNQVNTALVSQRGGQASR